MQRSKKRAWHIIGSCDERTGTYVSFISSTLARGRTLLRLLFTFCQAWWGHYVLKTILKVVQRQKILVSSDNGYNDKIFTFIFYISRNVLERYERERKYTLSPQNRIVDHGCVCLHISETSTFLSKIWKKIHPLKIVFKWKHMPNFGSGFLVEMRKTSALEVWAVCASLLVCDPSLKRGMKRSSFLRSYWIPLNCPVRPAGCMLGMNQERVTMCSAVLWLMWREAELN